MNRRARAAGVAVGVVLCLTLASATAAVPRTGSGAPGVAAGPDPSASSQPVVDPLTGLDPAKTYTMTITLVDDEHQRSARPVTVLLKTGLSPRV